MLQTTPVWVHRSFAMGGGPITVPQVMWTVGVRPSIANKLLCETTVAKSASVHRWKNINPCTFYKQNIGVRTSLKKNDVVEVLWSSPLPLMPVCRPLWPDPITLNAGLSTHVVGAHYP